MPYYYKRGIVAGVVIWLVMSFLVNRLDTRNQQMTSNIPVDTEVTYTPKHRTDFGMFLGFTIFGLFCCVPGPYEPRQRQDPAPLEQKN